jgi:predicted CXXCH cytochrome family protein
VPPGRLLLAAGLLCAAPAAAAGAVHPPLSTAGTCVTARCHARLLEPARGTRAISTHQPAADGDCTSCHDVSLPGAAHFVKGAPADAADTPEGAQPWDLALCTGCHDGALAAKDAPAGATGFMDGKRNLHAHHVQAARGPRCLPCHAPHAAAQPLLLRPRIPARGGALIPQEFRAEKGGGWCRTGCHAPKAYRR